MIDKIDSVEDPHLEGILTRVHNEAIGIIFTETTPVAATTPSGKLVIFDDGTTQRVYIKTGKGTLKYWGLT